MSLAEHLGPVLVLSAGPNTNKENDMKSKTGLLAGAGIFVDELG